ncbi:hypothetical protein EVAR_2656_1 [Eumeta japonica]|uniref:Uncharacterized protein n=1 Tax=Eumeta variegata TaxID=151549 RepID=A0A4C1SM42_EUMVA|nr:hypothetical protein EVAR_2656_1 [Eumeta japonica]
MARHGRSKQTRLPFKNVGSRATAPLEPVHSDLWGPMENLSCSASSTNGQDKQVESQLCGSPSTSTTHTGNILRHR